MLKKFMYVILAVSAVLLLSACGDSPNVPVESTDMKTTQTETSQTTESTGTTGIQSEQGVGERGDYGDDPAVTVPQEPSADATEPGTTEPGATEPGTTEPGTTEPDATEPGTTEPEENVLTFSEYKAMSVQEQEAFVDSFETLQDFVDWWNAAKAAEEKDDNTITGDPNIDLGDLIP